MIERFRKFNLVKENVVGKRMFRRLLSGWCGIREEVIVTRAESLLCTKQP